MFGANNTSTKEALNRLETAVGGHFEMFSDILDAMKKDQEMFKTIGERLDALESESK